MAHEAFQNVRVPISLSRFMELMRSDASRDLVKKINKFTQEMETVRKPDAVKDCKLVQSFLSKMESDLLKHRIWSDLSETDRMVMFEGVELYTMTKLYKRTFGRYKNDQERDAQMSSRLFALQFVTPTHLDIPSDVITQESMVSAMRELQKINAFKSPRDKLTCVLSCCQVIFNLLQSTGQETGADAFVPLMNYVVIKTQPIHLISNIEFIKRFRMKSRLVSYDDYYFTQLSAAAYFIESADAGSFTNGRQEFLSSFLQQGLITWKQYEEALLEERGELSRVPSFLSTGNVSEDNILGDVESVVERDLADLQSVTDEHSSARAIDWSNVHGSVQLEKEGQPVVNQLAASGDLITRHPYLSLQVVDLKVEAVEKLLAEYKRLALSYEVLSDTTDRNDTFMVLKLVTEYEIKAQWHSVQPAKRRLLESYPFLCSSFQDLSFRDVTRLLHGYKVLVLQCECLVAGIKRHVRNDPLSDLSPEEFDLLTDKAKESNLEQPPLITRLTEGPSIVPGQIDPQNDEASIVSGETPIDGVSIKSNDGETSKSGLQLRGLSSPWSLERDGSAVTIDLDINAKVSSINPIQIMLRVENEIVSLKMVYKE